MKTENFGLRQKFRFKSYFYRIFVSYILLIFLLAGCEFGIYKYIEKITLDREINRIEDNLYYISSIIDQKMRLLKEDIFAFHQSNEIIDYMRDPYDQVNQIKLYKSINQLATNKEAMDGCILFNENSVLSTDGIESSEKVVSEVLRLQGDKRNIDEGEINPNYDIVLLDMSKLAGIQTLNSNKEENMYIAILSGIKSPNQSYRMISLISYKKLAEVLRGSGTKQYGQYYFTDNNGYLLAVSEMGILNKSEDIKDLKNRAHMMKSRTFQIDRIPGKLRMGIVSSNKSGLYFSVVEEKDIFKSVITIRNTFILIILSMLCLGMIYAYFFSIRNYAPLAVLLNKLKPILGSKSYSDEFDLLHGTFQDVNQKNRLREKEKMLHYLVIKGEVPEQLQLFFDKTVFQAVLVKSSSPEITALLEDYIQQHPGEDFAVDGFSLSEKEYGIVLNADSLIRKATMEYFRVLKASFETSSEITILVGIGNSCIGLVGLKDSFDNAHKAIKQGSLLEGNSIFEHRESPDKQYSLFFPGDFEAKMEDVLQAGNDQGLSKLIGTIYDKNKELPMQYLEIITAQLINIYVRLAARKQGQVDIDQVKSSFTNEIRINRLQQKMNQLFQGLLNDKPEIKDSGSYVKEFIIEYIDLNYSSPDISIELMADKLGMSWTYVSALFKKSAGVSFSAYLMDCRIRAAKELLAQSDESVKSIAEKVGYTSSGSFVRAFKNNCGFTPIEYRNMSSK